MDNPVFNITRENDRKAERMIENNHSSAEKEPFEDPKNSYLEDFVYIASHDLQEPLRMVSSYVRLLQRKYAGKLDNEADEYINFAVDGVKRMKQMLDDLLTYSRLNKVKSVTGEVDCNELFEKIFQSVKKNYPGCIIKVHGSLPIIKADRDKISELVQHLLVNAVKFNKSAQPVVEIRSEKNKHDWLFYIKDNGIGIDENYRDKIFNIFQKLHNHSEFTGSGIGLALCKRIIEQHQGKIWVESQPGNGSTFVFSIPIGQNS